jgi:hypothetical protein
MCLLIVDQHYKTLTELKSECNEVQNPSTFEIQLLLMTTHCYASTYLSFVVWLNDIVTATKSK